VDLTQVALELAPALPLKANVVAVVAPNGASQRAIVGGTFVVSLLAARLSAKLHTLH
jgi:hypothetical protein